MKMPDGSWGKIADHPLGKQVKSVWDRELKARGYEFDVHVYSLPKKVHSEIVSIIDREVESWFENRSYWETSNLRNAWNYQARHKHSHAQAKD